ncbi:hypothetical protein [Paraburkholderia acidisoli]|jgi:hypothetical protein|uniref:Uncharacterized protein n=1 Tax=Paraburkholderia acidisoli TaxID=2571748 RepID=A0A7Z2JFP4_9BURK|nr:hypothetical protein [Paraburkholderia acidisoli]QGZ62138.1 hypothetical protein FAZ98_10580 [Paraburkholderia acidisoli]
MHVEFAFATPSMAAVAPRDAWFSPTIEWAVRVGSGEISTIVARTEGAEVRFGYDDENGHARVAPAARADASKTSGIAFAPVVMKTGMHLAFACTGASAVVVPVRRLTGGPLVCEGVRRAGGPEEGVMTFDAFTAPVRKTGREFGAAHVTGS